MDLEAIEKIAADTMMNRASYPNREPGWLYYHGHRTAQIALHLADLLKQPIDKRILYSGALFHDVSKGTEPHNEAGAREASKLLASHCTPDEIAAISDIVRLHNQRNIDGLPVIVQIEQDADLIDHVGPIGPWLAFYWSGSRGETIHDNMNFFQGEENRQYREGMRKHLHFDESKEEFDLRIRFEDEFFTTFYQVYLNGTWDGTIQGNS